MPFRPLSVPTAWVPGYLDGSRTLVRSVLKPQPDARCAGFRPAGTEPATGLPWFDALDRTGKPYDAFPGPDGRLASRPKVPFAVGDLLWVREAHYRTDDGHEETVVYAADADDVREHLLRVERLGPGVPEAIKARHRLLRPNFSMPRWASRLTLRVRSLRLERVQDADRRESGSDDAALVRASAAWDSIHGENAWASNPWTTTAEVERVLAGP